MGTWFCQTFPQSCRASMASSAGTSSFANQKRLPGQELRDKILGTAMPNLDLTPELSKCTTGMPTPVIPVVVPNPVQFLCHPSPASQSRPRGFQEDREERSAAHVVVRPKYPNQPHWMLIDLGRYLNIPAGVIKHGLQENGLSISDVSS